VILREVPPAYTTCNATSNGSMTAAEAQVVERLEEERLDSVFSKSPSGRRQVEIQLVFALEAGGGGGGQDNRGSGPWPFELAVTLLTGGWVKVKCVTPNLTMPVRRWRYLCRHLLLPVT
jgi:hypothetical protein